jgi:hypothetical protein
MNPVKRHNNMWYCWTHGYDVDHHSRNCMDPKHGHQYNATRTNTMGGCQAKKHKTVLPGNGSQGYMWRGGAECSACSKTNTFMLS